MVEGESKQGVEVWSSTQKDPPAIPTDSLPLTLVVLTGNDIQRHLPKNSHVEATGLEGKNLSYSTPWNISIRTDKEGESVYGPSPAPLEETVVSSAPRCFSPSGHCIGNVWDYAHSAFSSQDASCIVDGLHDVDLESADGG